MHKRKLFRFIGLRFLPSFLVVCMFFFSADILAQCPMCKMAAESNLKEGGSSGAGLNAGILYMLSMPYLLVGTIGFLWWRSRRKKNLLIES